MQNPRVAQPLRFRLRDYLKRHKKAAWLIAALVVLNEIRGLIVAYAVVVAVLKSHGIDVL